jgi:DGQHR domain-containing protein
MVEILPADQSAIAFKAIQVVQPIGTFYMASLPARELVGITYSDIRRLAEEDREVERYLGLQRPLSPTRVKAIRRYLESPDATFPTAVLIAVDERCTSYDPKSGTLMLKAYTPADDDEDDPIPLEKVGKVLDGQHRLAGFLNDDKQWSFDAEKDVERQFDINVAIFSGADLSEQATIFATVNLAQTKVNRSLAYDLEDFAQARSPFKTCHNIAVAMNSAPASPFFQRIKRLGVQTKGVEGETLTQASFVEALVTFISRDPLGDRNKLMEGKTLALEEGYEKKTPFRKMFLEGRDLDIAEIVNNYFRAVRQKWPTGWEQTKVQGNLLPRTNAFKALMRYLRDDVYASAAKSEGKEIPSVETFLGFFENLALTDADFTTRKFVPGSGGQSMFLKVLRGQVDVQSLFETNDDSPATPRDPPVPVP